MKSRRCVFLKRAISPCVLSFLLFPALPGSTTAQTADRARALVPNPAAEGAPRLDEILAFRESGLAQVVDRFRQDLEVLERRWDMPYSPARQARMRTFLSSWAQAVQNLEVGEDDLESNIDLVLLGNDVRYRLELLAREDRLVAEVMPLLPFADIIVDLLEAKHRHESADGPSIAGKLAGLAEMANEAARLGAMDARGESSEAVEEPGASPIVGLRAVRLLQAYRRSLGTWYRHYDGYDPIFTWWVKQPFQEADEAIGRYIMLLRERIVGWPEGEEEPIVGDPIGQAGMTADLIHEMIPYSPEELVAIAEREFAWCESRMLEASRELGYGDDWRAALEYVKTLHAGPGGQPEVVVELAQEAVDFISERGLVTVPPMAAEVWRLEMMSPERQRVSPFFLGGEVIRVSFPTDEMTHEEKRMSMRGNNIHFSRATVHHELIPGHHLQGFMTERFNSHRDLFRTPFWGEGWALYWEMLLWDLGFPATAEDRVGMLFWRMHRAARIIFSLSFHLGEMTPGEAVAFLVDRVGHEPANATAEVRRSFNGSYSPLYQAAYMVGGLQIRALRDQLVGSGEMTDRAFHDAILKGGRMPIEMVRARLLGEVPERDFQAGWRFYGDPL